MEKERKHILSEYRLSTVSIVSKYDLDWSALRFGLVLSTGPTPTVSVLLRKRPVLLRADFMLTKDPKWPGGKLTGRGLVVKRPGVLRKDEIGP